MLYICYKSKEERIPPEMTIQECVYYTIFYVHSLLLYIVPVNYTKLLYGHKDSLKIIKYNATNSQYAFNHYST